MVGLISDRAIENFAVAAPRRSGTGEIRICGAGIFLVLVLLMTYIYIPNRILDTDYRIETVKKDISRLSLDNQVLRMRESELLSVSRLEAEAGRLGMVAPQVSQIRFVESDQPLDGPAGRMAFAPDANQSVHYPD